MKMSHVSTVLQSICAEFNCKQLFMVDGKKPHIDAGVFFNMCEPDGTGMLESLRTLLAHQKLTFDEETQRNGTLLSMKAFLMMLMNGHRIKEAHQWARQKLMTSLCELALEGEWTNLDDYDEVSETESDHVDPIAQPSDSHADAPNIAADNTFSSTDAVNTFAPGQTNEQEASDSIDQQKYIIEQQEVPEEILLDGHIYHTVAVVNGEIHVVESSTVPAEGTMIGDENMIPAGAKKIIKVDNKSLVVRKTFKDGPPKVPTKEKRHFCEECGKGFTTSWSVKMHMRQHTGEKPHRCPHCDRAFSHKSDLTIHMRNHTGERPYKCDLCDREFCKSYTLRTHRRIHTGEKPYECPYCEKKFAQRNVQRHHIRLHTGEKPFKCEVCGKSFGQRCQVKQHQRYNPACNINASQEVVQTIEIMQSPQEFIAQEVQSTEHVQTVEDIQSEVVDGIVHHSQPIHATVVVQTPSGEEQLVAMAITEEELLSVTQQTKLSN